MAVTRLEDVPRAKEDVPKDIPVDEDLRKVMDVKEVHPLNALS